MCNLLTTSSIYALVVDNICYAYGISEAIAMQMVKEPFADELLIVVLDRGVIPGTMALSLEDDEGDYSVYTLIIKVKDKTYYMPYKGHDWQGNSIPISKCRNLIQTAARNKVL